ncbi:MAG: hypothetical protein AAF152_04120, partial [Cyanobacteria bacterium P01_A01_bin.114]
FLHEGAGYKNTLGVYRVDPDTGQIHDVQIAWDNVSAVGSGGETSNKADRLLTQPAAIDIKPHA